MAHSLALEDGTRVEIEHTPMGVGFHARRRFVATSHRELTDAEVVRLQEQCGFHPMGYGHNPATRDEKTNGAHVTRWSCAASCD